MRVGLACCGAGGLLIALSVQFIAPSYLSVMLPVAFSGFGIAFLTPHMTTAALQSFPHIAGSASAMVGFIQMMGGFLGGLAAALLGTPFTAFGLVIPAMLFLSVASYMRFAALTRRAALDGAGE